MAEWRNLKKRTPSCGWSSTRVLPNSPGAMPVDTYREMWDRDLAAIAAYLHRIKPIRHAVARTEFKTPPAAHDPAEIRVEAPPRQDTHLTRSAVHAGAGGARNWAISRTMNGRSGQMRIL